MSYDPTALDAAVYAVSEAAPEADQTGQFPWTGIRAVHQAELLESTVATRYGGPGGTLSTAAHILAALGRGDPSVALISAMTIFTHLGQATKDHWPDGLYRDLLSKAKDRPLLLNAARVEPELGSPARGGLPATRARRTANGWSITGRKRFVTGAHGLTHFLVWAHTDEAQARVGTFVVPNGLPGIRIIENWKSLGMRATGSHDVEYTEVEIPAENVLELVDPSVAQQDNRSHAAMTLALTAIYLGAAEAAQEAFIRFAHERVPANLGHPIARTERFVTLSGEIDLLVSGARQIIFGALTGHIGDAEHLIRARLLAGRQIREAVQLAVRGIGNPGLNADLGLERHFRDIQSVLVHAPQEDTSVAILGRATFDRWKTSENDRSTHPAALSILKTA
ncbi:alkylation response protein AidB-like acyl-CoA dehydrogenase [Agrobacterium tumefaciens]|uniref:Alkylation response protein AidB-like acyl-CoA dehydrogenase n=1 Tax=Agrobacterium radiobacter TaxID=362 RepID=A0ABR6JAS4_AGRRD|nr:MULTISPECIES: acyl-CoA dehydrogenase family protein [Agrobacterium tumefaciens complex]TGE77589.1 acyl-CoA dehydrogenase [Rhizobium sp. SEMIA 439]KAA1233312.1 acyl-CoA dehydrogenase [Agrobacterium tumefaciens]MBB4283390.1 alkylation response protein AidB-like acyl-CoA dehydrogenase [Agrobacterium radiobacter]MBB4320085.1 alkylation response protein AidB-like acyl-CoA dehydrogenase [Agrobacterium radiobacter]MBB4325311.1 alkylation response protein AidB-like acyl-CoA dehydrogenase [Agrobacte